MMPIVLCMLGYNYQSNQNSLESIPKYFFEHIKPIIEKKSNTKILGWEKYFAIQKEPFKVESVAKVFPFILPVLIPIYFLLTKFPLQDYQTIIAIVDIMFFLFMIENFRYKLRRVK